MKSSEGEKMVEMASGDSMTTVSGLTKETVYTVEVAAETSGGTGVYSKPLTIETPDSECVFLWLWHSSCPVLFTPSTDVYLSLNGEIIPNHGYVEKSDIGYSDRTALLCHTNKPAIRNYTPYSRGDWFAPDGARVGGVYYNMDVSGFGRNRGPMVVRLRRSNWGATPEEGIYWCKVNDTTDTLQTVHIGLYNIGEGILYCIHIS